ncbi:MAG: 2-phosphosulfolactate phosphatase [Bacteroidota bacterium]
MDHSIYNQQEFDIRLEWGIRGVEELAPVSDVVIIVDILSFSSSVNIATEKGALIYPYQWKDETAIAFAKSNNAELAGFNRRYTQGYSLSPSSLLSIPKGTKLVLPSPNGSTLSLATGKKSTLCGSLRNARAVAKYAMKLGEKIVVIPAGEKWSDGSLRVAYEDLIGAGAIVSYLEGKLSPEAQAAKATFDASKNQLLESIKACSSGKELIARGFEKDVELACELNVSRALPLLTDGCYKRVSMSDSNALGS